MSTPTQLSSNKSATFTTVAYRQCTKECEIPIKGKIKGEIPSWIQGSLYRNGPGNFQFGDTRHNHLFDGMALVHKFTFENGHVSYQNRFIQSQAYKRNVKANKIVVSEFGTNAWPDPCESFFQRFKSWFFPKEPEDNTLVTVIPYGNEVYTLTETPRMNQIDPNTLGVIQQRNIKNFVKLDIKTITAHAHVDHDDTVYNVCSTIDSKGVVFHVIRTPVAHDELKSPKFEESSVVASVKGQYKTKVSYLHSFGITENYVIFLEQPLYLSVPKFVLSPVTGATFASSLHYNDCAMARFHIIRKDDGQVIPITYEADPFFFFHHVNAYEDNGNIVVDLCCYKDASIIDALYLKNIEEAVKNPTKEYYEKLYTDVRRYILPLENSKENTVKLPNSTATAEHTADNAFLCKPEIIYADAFCELPTINYTAINGKKYKYIYATEATKDFKQALIKINTETKEVTTWSEEGQIPSEPIMLQNPTSESEDEGVVISCLHDANNEKLISMLVLDSKTFEEIGRAEFELPGAATATFHGYFDWA